MAAGALGGLVCVLPFGYGLLQPTAGDDGMGFQQFKRTGGAHLG